MTYKKILLILVLLFLNNCAVSGSAFLGPIYTGAKTGSIYQASISYSTGKIMNELVSSKISTKKNEIDKSEILPKKDEIQNPLIISSYKVIEITFSEVMEEEPLP